MSPGRGKSPSVSTEMDPLPSFQRMTWTNTQQPVPPPGTVHDILGRSTSCWRSDVTWRPSVFPTGGNVGNTAQVHLTHLTRSQGTPFVPQHPLRRDFGRSHSGPGSGMTLPQSYPAPTPYSYTRGEGTGSFPPISATPVDDRWLFCRAKTLTTQVESRILPKVRSIYHIRI